MKSSVLRFCTLAVLSISIGIADVRADPDTPWDRLTDSDLPAGQTAGALEQNSVHPWSDTLEAANIPVSGIFLPDLPARVRGRFLQGTVMGENVSHVVNRYLSAVLLSFDYSQHGFKALPLKLRELEFLVETLSYAERADAGAIIREGSYRVIRDLAPVGKDREFMVASLAPLFTLTRIPQSVDTLRSVHLLLEFTDAVSAHFGSPASWAGYRIWLNYDDGSYAPFPVCAPQINEPGCVDLAALIRSIYDPLSLYGGPCGPAQMVVRGKRQLNAASGSYAGYACQPSPSLCGQAVAGSGSPVTMPSNSPRSRRDDYLGNPTASAGLTSGEASVICTSPIATGGSLAGYNDDCVLNALSQMQQAETTAANGIAGCVAAHLNEGDPAFSLDTVTEDLGSDFGCQLADASSSTTAPVRASLEQIQREAEASAQQLHDTYKNQISTCQSPAHCETIQKNYEANMKALELHTESRREAADPDRNPPPAANTGTSTPPVAPDSDPSFLDDVGDWLDDAASDIADWFDNLFGDSVIEESGTCSERKAEVYAAASECFEKEVERALAAAGMPSKGDHPLAGSARVPTDPRKVYPVEPTAAAVDPVMGCFSGGPDPETRSRTTMANGCGLILCPENDPDCCQATSMPPQAQINALQLIVNCMEVLCAEEGPCPCSGDIPPEVPSTPPNSGPGGDPY